MQQSITNNKNDINLLVELDQLLYKAGDNVTGKIFLEVLAPFSGNLLKLKIKGYEISYFEKKKTATQLEKDEPVEFAYFVPHQGKRKIYNTITSIYQWQGDENIIPEGQYVFPFAFSLLQNIPANFQEEILDGEKKYKAIVKYKVKAFINGLKKEKIKNSFPLIIRKSLYPEQLQPNSSSFVVEPVTWCCLSKGETLLKTLLNKSAFAAGETVHVKIEIDNSSCSISIQDLCVSLVKYINLSGDDGKSWMLKTEIQKQVFEGIKAKQKANGESTRQCEFNLQYSDSKPIQPSTKGNLVLCEYYILIQVNFNGVICCDQEYEYKLPITITPNPASPVNSNNFKQLPNWKPQVFEVVNVHVDVVE